jgi:hypothetical protein
VLPTIFGENKPQLEFGARVEQAKNLCTNRRNCRFGYTFGRDKDLSTSESKNLQNSVAQKRTRIGNEEISRRRVPRVRIDPRRRKNEEEQLAESEDPVTIKIGGVPIVIPDFDLAPAKSENTLRRPESDKKRRRNRFQTKRKNISRNKNRTTISFKAATPTITETKSSKLTTTTSQATRSRLTTTTSPATRPRLTTTTSPASRPRLTTTTSPASKAITNTLFTTLTSFDSLQETVENAASTPVKFSTIFTTLSLPSPATTLPPVTRTINTTERPKHVHRGRITKKHRQPTQTPAAASTSRNVFTSTKTTERYQNKECPESLEKCVDACVPLQDIYAYSACVVECGERCPVVLD